MDFGRGAQMFGSGFWRQVALRLGKRVEWDAKNLVAKNAPEAAPLIRRAYRKGWELA